jgi:glutaredoxin
VLDRVRTSLHRVITTPAGDRFFPVRVPKDLARRFNALLGDPLCSSEELERRRAGHAKLDALKRRGGRPATAPADAPAVQAPLMIYFAGERNARKLGPFKELLDAKRITYTLLDVADDQATREFVLREAKCKDEELPVVFVGGAAVGGYDALVEWEASGKLAKALAGR